MKNIVVALALMFTITPTLNAKENVIVRVEFENDLFPQSSFSLATPVAERRELGLRLGVQGFKVQTATGFERESVQQTAITYVASGTLIENALEHRMGFALGQNHASESVGGSQYNFFEMSQGFGVGESKIKFHTDVVTRVNFVGNGKTMIVGGKIVPSYVISPRFGFSLGF